MKTRVAGWIVVAWMFACSASVRAQSAEAELIPPELVPASGTFFMVQQTNWPPLPYAPPDLPVYWLGDGLFLVDDSSLEYAAQSSLDDAGPLNGGQFMDGGPFNYGCGLWLEIAAATNHALLTLHNTRTGQTYTVFSLTNLSFTNWIVETNLTGAGGDFTQTLIPMGPRSNLFLRVSEIRDYATNLVFQGLSHSNTPVYNPDAMGAVGPNHFVELLNDTTLYETNTKSIAVYDKSGNLVAWTNSFDFFRVGTNHSSNPYLVDPRILYDHQAQRWVASIMDRAGGANNVILAVSNGENPTNLATAWSRYTLHLSGSFTFIDFPTLGLDANGLYLTVRQLGGATNPAHTVVAIKKPEIYQGTLITNYFDITNGVPIWAIQPAVNFDDVPTNGYAWFVAKGPPDLGTNYQGGALHYRRLQWSGTNATLVDTNWNIVTNIAGTYRDYYDLYGTNINVFPGPSDGVMAPSLNGAAIDLHFMGSALAMTAIRNGFLWTCQAVGLNGTNGTYAGDVAGTNVDRSGVQWLKLCVDAASGSLSYSAHGRVYDNTATTNAFYYYFPSIMVNCAGDAVMGFSGSSATNYIGAYYSWRLASGSTLSIPRPIQVGLTNYVTTTRWGDYSATTLDPTDDWSFWSVQQYADPSGVDDAGDFPWSTVIGKIRTNP